MVAAGKIKPDTLVWHKGLLGWETASKHFFAAPPEDGPPPLPTNDAQGAGPAEKNGVPDFAQRVAQRHQSEGRLTSTDPQTYAQKSIAADRATHHLGNDGLYCHAPSRGFIEAIGICFRKYATFKGRASRSEYWFFYLFATLLYMLGGLATVKMGEDGQAINGVISLILFMPLLSAQVRRLHDTNRSGWWLGSYWLLIFGGGAFLGYVGYQAHASNTTDSFDAAILGPFVIWGIMIGILSILLLVFSVRIGSSGPNKFG
jgi:uncharacterized membrane protein YhaH (DUF805 family)